jgi:hypothetical protein
MRIVAFFLTVSGVAAFAPAFGVSSSRSHTALEAASTMKEVRKSIGKLSKENMSTVLSDIEPFLLNNAGPSFYSKSLNRIVEKAKILGADVPSGYAKAAKATEKRREKQDAFVKAKIAAAEEAAAAAAAEAAAATEAAAAPAEEAAAE